LSLKTRAVPSLSTGKRRKPEHSNKRLRGRVGMKGTLMGGRVPVAGSGAAALAVAVIVAASGCDGELPVEPDPPAPSILERVQEAGTFTSFEAAVDGAGLSDALASEGPFTLLAPLDEAFRRLPEGLWDEIASDPDRLARVAGFHLVEGAVSLEDLRAGGPLPTLAGDTLFAVESQGSLTVGGVAVMGGDVGAGNGMLHVMADVLFPDPVFSLAQVARREGEFRFFLHLLETAGLADLLEGEEPLTVLVPTDGALAELGEEELGALEEDEEALARFLRRHLVPGAFTLAEAVEGGTLRSLEGDELIVTSEDGEVEVDGVAVLRGDLEGVNGILHALGGVLRP
jgi:transforming growth factor-beta-induced protein